MIQSLSIIAVILLVLAGPPAQTQVGGPTPYPSRPEEWPGVGVTRVFDWMSEYRRSFWRQREAKRGSIALAGDSLTEGWPNASLDLEGAPVANLGIGGDVSRGLLFRFEEDVLALHPAGHRGRQHHGDRRPDEGLGRPPAQ